LKTVTAALPALAMSPAGIDAVTWPELTKVVARSAPFQRTRDEEMKLLPFTVSVKDAPPAVAEVGLMLVIAGTGFAAVIVNVTEFEIPPPGDGLNTVIVALPALAISLAEIEAVSWLALPKVVGRSAPFQRTRDEEMKLLPLTVSVKAAPPAVAEVGLMLVIAGTEFAAVIVKVTELEIPPPGDGLKTVTAALPALAISLAGIAAVT
jgi:hypothetical protein